MRLRTLNFIIYLILQGFILSPWTGCIANTKSDRTALQGNNPSKDKFQVGIFWPPVWEQTNPKQYKAIKEANVDYIQNVLGSLLDTEERNLKMLELAGKYGMKMFVADPRVNGTPEDIKAMVETYRKYPATSGYYVVDEPDLKGMTEAARKYKSILSVDQQAVPYVNLLPSWAVPDYESYVNHWMEVCGKENMKYLSFDCYPFMVDGSMRNTYYRNLDIIRKAGLENQVKTSCYLQSIGIPGSYRRPNASEMRLNVYSCLAYGIKNLVWFTYWTPTNRGEKFTNAIIDSCGNKTDLYRPFQQLNHQMRQLGKTLIGLDAQAVYHTGNAIPEGAEQLPGNFIIRPENNNAELIITRFTKNNSSEQYVMVVNKSISGALVVQLKLDKTVTAIRQISSVSGKPENVKVNRNGNLELDLLPGEGKLFEIHQSEN